MLGTGTTAIFPPDGHMGDYLALAADPCARSHPRRIFPAHGPVRDDALPLIDEYICPIAWSASGRSSAAVGRRCLERRGSWRRRIYPQLDERLHGAAEIQIRAHLIKLAEEGRVDAALIAG